MPLRVPSKAALAGAAAFSMMTAGAADLLKLEVYNPGSKSMFPVSSTILLGKQEAMLVDAQFQRNDAEALVAKIKASGRKLTMVYISHSDPDYYFGLGVVKAAFPEAKVVATPNTVAAIQASKDGKLAYWGPLLKENAPKQLLVPQALAGDSIRFEGQDIKVIGLDGPQPDRSFVWIPSLRAVVGGIPVSANLHVWMADTPTAASRLAWLQTLDRIDALKPSIVVPGHYIAHGDKLPGVESVAFTRGYLRFFQAAAASAKDASALVAAVRKQYPGLPGEDELELGAKVAKGEAEWPPVPSYPLAGKSARVQFGESVFELTFKDRQTMSFIGVQGPFKGLSDTVQYTALEVRPGVFMVYWSEPHTGVHVVHVQDLTYGVLHTNIVMKDGQTMHMTGSIQIR